MEGKGAKLLKEMVRERVAEETEVLTCFEILRRVQMGKRCTKLPQNAKNFISFSPITPLFSLPTQLQFAW